MAQHALVRTNAKGEGFIGRCVKCGEEGLTFGDMDTGQCANPNGMTDTEALLGVLDDSDAD